MLPRNLVNWTAIIEGTPLTGAIKELVLPVLERKLEKFRAAGMLGEVSLDMGLEAMKIEGTLAEFSKAVMDTWGVARADGVGFRFMGAYRADDGQPVEAIEATVRGRLVKLDYGTVEQGKLTEVKFEMACTYFKVTSNSTVRHEIDLVNGIEIVNGVDRQADARKAAGLG